MRFAAIDVETANPSMASICQIGVAIFENEALCEEWQSFVDPEDFFDPINSSIHGIEETDVQGAPTFTTIADELFELIGDHPLVAHTHFDKAAIAQTCRKYEISLPEFRWLDSARVARRAWLQFAAKGYGLKNLCSYIGYSFEHHNALEDAKAAGHVMIAAISESGIALDDWFRRVGQPICPSTTSGGASPIVRDGNPDGDLFGEVLVFTGALEIPRRMAADMAATIGCEVAKGVTKKTTLLIVGDQDISRLAGHSKSSKHRKAEGLIAKGVPIRILCESDFKQIVEGV
jgi:DNA polymerase-3 subunit epsilon